MRDWGLSYFGRLVDYTRVALNVTHHAIRYNDLVLQSNKTHPWAEKAGATAKELKSNADTLQPLMLTQTRSQRSLLPDLRTGMKARS
jgi:hypothetical protein